MNGRSRTRTNRRLSALIIIISIFFFLFEPIHSVKFIPSFHVGAIPFLRNKCPSSSSKKKTRGERKRRKQGASSFPSKKVATTTEKEEKPSIAWHHFLSSKVVITLLSFTIKFGFEQTILQLLPFSILLILIQICLRSTVRPRVLRLVLMEVESRICNYTGKDRYRLGDLSRTTVNRYTGKEDYHFGDVSRATLRRYTDKDEYRFGDVSRATLQKTRNSILSYTGKDSYSFGDVTRRFLSRFTAGDDQYQFGDITRQILNSKFDDTATGRDNRNKKHQEELRREMLLIPKRKRRDLSIYHR